jgi:hypothetical protein
MINSFIKDALGRTIIQMGILNTQYCDNDKRTVKDLEILDSWLNDRSNKLTQSEQHPLELTEKHLERNIDYSITEALDNHSLSAIIEERLDKLNLTNLINSTIRTSLVKTIMNQVSPYYKEEFYATLSYGKIRISPWWDNIWQEIELKELVKDSIEMGDNEEILHLKEILQECIQIVNDTILLKKISKKVTIKEKHAN